MVITWPCPIAASACRRSADSRGSIPISIFSPPRGPSLSPPAALAYPLHRRIGRRATVVSDRIHGMWAAMATPLDAEGGVDYAALARHGRWLIEQGCDGVVPFGTTGEGP